MAERLMKEVRGLLFDLDGTLCDTTHLHYRAWSCALTERGLPRPSWQKYRRECLLHQRKVEEVFAPTNEGIDWTGLHQRKTHHLKTIAPHELETLPGVRRFVATADEFQIPKAVVSTARRTTVDLVLTHLRLPPFDAVVSRDDVSAVKPNPQPFLHALQEIGVEPRTGVAFDDAPPGIAAARAAGLFTVAVASPIFQRPQQGEAHHWIDGLGQVCLRREHDTIALWTAD